MKRATKLTERDKVLIGELKAIRADMIRQSRNLTDKILAEKFECSRSWIERIPEAGSVK